MEFVSDKTLLQKVNQRMSRMGGAQGQVIVAVMGGDVTLTGTLQYETQRLGLVKTASSVAGVRRVIDQLRVQPPKNAWDQPAK